MPEVRSIEVFEYPDDAPREEKVSRNAKRTYEEYTVSDEQLANEKDQKDLEALIEKPDRSKQETNDLIKLMAKKLGI